MTSSLRKGLLLALVPAAVFVAMQACSASSARTFDSDAGDDALAPLPDGSASDGATVTPPTPQRAGVKCETPDSGVCTETQCQTAECSDPPSCDADDVCPPGAVWTGLPPAPPTEAVDEANVRCILAGLEKRVSGRYRWKVAGNQGAISLDVYVSSTRVLFAEESTTGEGVPTTRRVVNAPLAAASGFAACAAGKEAKDLAACLLLDAVAEDCP